MEEFSILDSEILWNKKNKIPESHKTAIKEYLKTMSTPIKNAMKFTSDNEQSIVSYSFSPEQECEVFYILEVYVAGCEEEQKYWHAVVRDESNGTHLADIYNEKVRLYTSLLEEDAQPDCFSK
jgi:hypothetical protein